MGTVAVYYPMYSSWYEPQDKLSTVRVTVRLIPYYTPYGSGWNGRMYGIYQKYLILAIILLSLALDLV
jgi:hypothetical protein